MNRSSSTLPHRTLALLLAAAAGPVQAIERMQAPQSVAGETGYSILHTRLRAAAAHHLETDAGSFATAPGCERFLRKGERLRAVSDLTPYLGRPLSLRLVDGQVVWAVVEIGEVQP